LAKQRIGVAFKQIRVIGGRKLPQADDVGGECAVLMMADGRQTPMKPAFPARIPQKHALDLIGGGHRFCDQNTRNTID
jgi:hypothetical protein